MRRYPTYLTGKQGHGATPPPGTLLQPSDFTFLGSYRLQVNNWQYASFGSGITCRRVSGNLRFLVECGSYIEFSLPGTFGDIVTQTNDWGDIWANTWWTSPIDEHGFWWDEETGRLWSNLCWDYPDDGALSVPWAITTRVLNSNGTISDIRSGFGCEGVSWRAIHGNTQRIPDSFRSTYGITQKYATGWGGYTSRMAQGNPVGGLLGTPSMGLMAVAIPDPADYAPHSANPNDGVFPIGTYKIMADHTTGVQVPDWYVNPGSPTSMDRGVRGTFPVNYYDGGDPRPNPPGRPTVPPDPAGYWESNDGTSPRPAPDGLARWCWGDTYGATGCWIHGANKQGFIVIGSMTRGYGWYAGSTLHHDALDAELTIFDPAHFGEVIQGSRHPWNVQPVGYKLLNTEMEAKSYLSNEFSGFNTSNGPIGACYDPVDARLYVWCRQPQGGYGNDLFVYQVDA